MTESAAQTPPLRRRTKLAYGIGQAAEGIKNSAFGSLLLFFYVQVLGVSPGWAGTALLVALIFDAVTDPLVGSLSDALDSRWGRRHPWMYASAIPLGVAFFFVFSPPPGLSERQLLGWLLLWTVLTRAAMTLYHVPHLALGAELSWDYTERARVVAYRVMGGFGGAAAFFLVSARIFFPSTPEFPDGQLNATAYPTMALACGVVMAVTILLSAVGTHRRIPWLVPPTTEQPFSLARLLGEMRETLRNHNFRVFFVAVLALLVGRGFADSLGFFMGTYFWQLEKQDIFQVTAVALAAIVLGVPIWAAAVRRWEKRSIFLVGCVSLGIFSSIAPLLKIVGFFPANEHPLFLPLVYGFMFVTSFGTAAAVTVPGAMIADVADEHELDTGDRQEGMFFGALSFSGKAAAGVGGWLAGICLELIRFPQPEAPGQQVAPDAVPGGTLVLLGLLAGPGLVIFGVVGIWLVARYDLGRERHAAIRRELDARGATSGGGEA